MGCPKDDSKIDEWHLYPSAIEEYDNLDLVLVDGRFRIACCIKSHPKVNGFILLHDSQRKEYEDAGLFLEHFKTVGSLTAFRKKTPEVPLEELFEIYRWKTD
jgi:hypothetical protein